MNLSEDKEKIYCHLCKKWRRKIQDTLLLEEMVFCLHCMEQGRDTMLGYEWDIFPEEKNDTNS